MGGLDRVRERPASLSSESSLCLDAIVHLAAYVGGIGANRQYPASFFYRNTLLTALMVEAAAERGKLIYPMGGCSYPARAIA